MPFLLLYAILWKQIDAPYALIPLKPMKILNIHKFTINILNEKENNRIQSQTATNNKETKDIYMYINIIKNYIYWISPILEEIIEKKQIFIT